MARRPRAGRDAAKEARTDEIYNARRRAKRALARLDRDIESGKVKRTRQVTAYRRQIMQQIKESYRGESDRGESRRCEPEPLHRHGKEHGRRAQKRNFPRKSEGGKFRRGNHSQGEYSTFLECHQTRLGGAGSRPLRLSHEVLRDERPSSDFRECHETEQGGPKAR